MSNLSSLPQIADKFDTDSAEHLVVIGYPANKPALPDLIFWSCWPNDPVCWITYPYIDALRDDYLAEPMAEFLEFHLQHQQLDMISDAFGLFINPRGQAFRHLVCSFLKTQAGRDLFVENEAEANSKPAEFTSAPG